MIKYCSIFLVTLLLSINAYAVEYQISEYTGSTPPVNAPDQLYTDASGLGGSYTNVYGQNSSGQYVGAITFYSSHYQTDYENAFIWDSANGASLIAGMSHAMDINNSSQVAGYFYRPWTSSTGVDAVTWDSTNGIHDLGTLGYKYSWAYGINDYGWVVGSSATLDPTNSNHAFIWNSQDSMVDLNTYLPENSGWLLTGAQSISNIGQIIGTGELNGQSSSFIMTPTVVPEPVSTVLFITGGGLLAGRRYMRKKSGHRA